MSNPTGVDNTPPSSEESSTGVDTNQSSSHSIVQIGTNIFKYKKNEDKYIITYDADYHDKLNTYIDNIFNAIYPMYDENKLKYANICGDNAKYVCNNLKIDGIKNGKIIIMNWVQPEIKKNLTQIESVYGPIGITIGASYHALVYLEITIEEQKYYIAIETTTCIPYKLQFYIGTNISEFTRIIKHRYQCNNFKISSDCDKYWYSIATDNNIADNSGGKKHKTLKTKGKKKKKNKKVKVKTHKNKKHIKTKNT